MSLDPGSLTRQAASPRTANTLLHRDPGDLSDVVEVAAGLGCVAVEDVVEPGAEDSEVQPDRRPPGISGPSGHLVGEAVEEVRDDVRQSLDVWFELEVQADIAARLMARVLDVDASRVRTAERRKGRTGVGAGRAGRVRELPRSTVTVPRPGRARSPAMSA